MRPAIQAGLMSLGPRPTNPQGLNCFADARLTFSNERGLLPTALIDQLASGALAEATGPGRRLGKLMPSSSS